MIAYLSQVVEYNDPTSPGSPYRVNGVLQNINTLADVINLTIKLLFPLVGVLLFFYLAWGGLNLIWSRGDPEKVTAGKAKLSSAVIGFLLLFMSYFLVGVIARIFGLGSGIF